MKVWSVHLEDGTLIGIFSEREIAKSAVANTLTGMISFTDARRWTKAIVRLPPKVGESIGAITEIAWIREWEVSEEANL